MSTVKLKEESGEVFNLPFKFQYTEDGVWVRAVYTGKGIKYPEDAPAKLESLAWVQGEAATGFPAAPLSADLLNDILSNANAKVPFREASKVILEYYMASFADELPEVAIAVKVWGVRKLDDRVPSPIPRIRMLYRPKYDRWCFMDDVL